MEGKPKRFLVFAHDRYYPSGGMGDCEGSFDTLEDARKFCKDNNILRYDFVDIFDLETGETHAPVTPSKFNIWHGRIFD